VRSIGQSVTCPIRLRCRVDKSLWSTAGVDAEMCEDAVMVRMAVVAAVESWGLGRAYEKGGGVEHSAALLFCVGGP
jgi:hypothetical protein